MFWTKAERVQNSDNHLKTPISLIPSEISINWDGELKETSDEISLAGMIWRYALHGFTLGTILLGGVIILTVFIVNPYSMVYMLVGIPFIGAIYYALMFGLTGGVNQFLAGHIWRIKCEQNIGTGLRDGLILFLLVNLAALPLIVFMNAMSLTYMYGLVPVPTPLQLILLFSLIFSIYTFVIGAIGRGVAVFMYGDKEPEVPSDFAEHSYRCPHCGANYYYDSEKIHDQSLTCQNCAREFSIEERLDEK
jgi:DNA-directed RNA polymerase subunit RPC12/RpoP